LGAPLSLDATTPPAQAAAPALAVIVEKPVGATSKRARSAQMEDEKEIEASTVCSRRTGPQASPAPSLVGRSVRLSVCHSLHVADK
jgi:hypothetical protein